MKSDTKRLELLVKMASLEGYVDDGKAHRFTTEERGLFDTMIAEMAADLAAETSETQHGGEKRSYDDKPDTNTPKLTRFEYDELAEKFVESESSNNQHDVDKRAYIVTDYEAEYSKAIKMTVDQAKAINWFIDNMSNENQYYCYPAEECLEEL